VAEIEGAIGEEVHNLVNRGLISLNFSHWGIVQTETPVYEVSITNRGRHILGKKVKNFPDSLIN